jgi:hypothetical protein
VSDFGGWVSALFIGLLCYLLGIKVVPGVFGKVLEIVGIVLLVVAAILFVLWVVGLITGGTAIAALAAPGLSLAML